MPSRVSPALAAALVLGGYGASAAAPPAATRKPAPAATAQKPAEPAPPPAATPADPPPAEVSAGYDEVGYATVGAGANLHRSLPPGDLVEVTAIDSGRTLLISISGPNEGRDELSLSPEAATALGIAPGARAAVRVRAARPTVVDRGALQSGQPFVTRPDAPPILLSALRKKLGPPPKAVAPPATPPPPKPRPQPQTPPPVKPRPAPTQPAPPKAPAAAPAPTQQSAAGPGYYVQIAALSDPARARSVANSVGGRVVPAGRMHRVRLGPFANQAAAKSARDAIARRGYGDARIVRE